MIRNRYNKIQIPHATSFAFCYCSWHCMRGYLQPGRLCMRKPWKGHRRASTQQQDHYLLLYAESNRKITAKALQNGIFMCMFLMKLLGTDSMSIAWGPDALNSSHESCWLTRVCVTFQGYASKGSPSPKKVIQDVSGFIKFADGASRFFTCAHCKPVLLLKLLFFWNVLSKQIFVCVHVGNHSNK